MAAAGRSYLDAVPRGTRAAHARHRVSLQGAQLAGRVTSEQPHDGWLHGGADERHRLDLDREILALGDRETARLTHGELDATLALMLDGVDCGWTPTDSDDTRDLDSPDGIWLLPAPRP